MADNVTPPPEPTVVKTPRYLSKVYTKDQWNTGDWTLAPYLQAVELTERSLHGDTTCSLQFDFGVVKREDATTAVHEFPSDLVGKFVCIRVTPDPVPIPQVPVEVTIWVGVIIGEGIGVSGIRSDVSGNPEPAGTHDVPRAWA